MAQQAEKTKLIRDARSKLNQIETYQENDQVYAPEVVVNAFDAMLAIALTSKLGSLESELAKRKTPSALIKERFLMTKITIPVQNLLPCSDQATSRAQYDS